MLATIALATTLIGSPAAQKRQPAAEKSSVHATMPLAIYLHSMTDDEKRMFPGRERWDKTEWYEAQFKSAKIVTAPEHVDDCEQQEQQAGDGHDVLRADRGA